MHMLHVCTEKSGTKSGTLCQRMNPAMSPRINRRQICGCDNVSAFDTLCFRAYGQAWRCGRNRYGPSRLLALDYCFVVVSSSVQCSSSTAESPDPDATFPNRCYPYCTNSARESRTSPLGRRDYWLMVELFCYLFTSSFGSPSRHPNARQAGKTFWVETFTSMS